MFVTVRMPDGATHRLEALEGWRIMEVIRDWGIPIKAECGGACACATCHVWVGEEWVGKLDRLSSEADEVYALFNNNRDDFAPRSAQVLRGLLDEASVPATGGVAPPPTELTLF